MRLLFAMITIFIIFVSGQKIDLNKVHRYVYKTDIGKLYIRFLNIFETTIC